MRIAIDLTALLPEETGVDRAMKQLVLHLGKIDLENRYAIFLNHEDRKIFGAMLPDNFRIVTLSLRPRLIRAFFQQVALPLAARRWCADVVHSPAFIIPLYRGDQRHVVTVHDMTSFSLPQHHIRLRRNLFYKNALRTSIRRAHLVVAPSHATKRSILKFMPGLLPSKVQVIPWGISEAFRLNPLAQTNKMAGRLKLPSSYILYVGTIEPRKNLSLLVEAYRRLLRGEDIPEHLVMAGRLGWGYRALLEQIEAASELHGRVHLTGYIAEADLPRIYAGARLFVYPSLEEGFGFPPLEAMACGVPTIASDCSSLAENLNDAAELVRPDDNVALAKSMQRMLCDEAYRQEHIARGLARAAQFNWQQTARQTLEAYTYMDGSNSQVSRL